MGAEKQIRHFTVPRQRSGQAGSQWGNHRKRSDLKIGHHDYVAGWLPTPYLVTDQDARSRKKESGAIVDGDKEVGFVIGAARGACGLNLPIGGRRIGE